AVPPLSFWLYTILPGEQAFVFGRMNDSEFWNIISKIDIKALDQGDDDAAVRPVQDILCCLKDESKLVAFEEVLAQKLYALDGEAYAKNAGESDMLILRNAKRMGQITD